MEKNNLFDSYRQVLDACFEKESDRASAILAVAFLDELMEEQLLRFFVDAPQVRELFVGYGPLSSFSARIGILFALGFLSEESRAELHLVRKIRNHFAHHPHHTSFADSPVKDMCASFPIAKDKEGSFYSEDPKALFIYTVSGIVGSVVHTMNRKKKRAVPKT